ncbi:hypothetical protein L861_19685 [Litchfieldella anticariensis FP35 = DSM 16096]|uniref:DUF2559 domain-containing protein n=1 Tax=Litchfieldella anticariensis (strain DSM 16096 / CECT 5854 / CIP 108499 / LMG 22089 / FP35) TaxID=1121939 RepID=S2KIV4_LITA3|nr:YhfG family protein [Halomonas anticariensis]EPC01875.1 hypothetical protein L861_19685 [Halomonas anticariensis FP35 = DSM 16096]
MTHVSLKTKQAYFTKVKRANYAASMRLEGFSVTSESYPTASKAAILEKYRRRDS